MHDKSINTSVINIPLLLANILDLLEYKNDKDKFITSFSTHIYLRVIEELVNTLDDVRQKQFYSERNLQDISPWNMEKTISNFFTEQQINRVSNRVAYDEISEYIETIKTTLSDDTYNKLYEIMKILK